MKLVLAFQGAHIPSFKNSKLLTNRRLITNPKYQLIMERVVKAFVLQLESGFPMGADVTLTGPLPPSSIALWLPEDDSWKCIPEIHVCCETVPEGEEGCIVTIESLDYM